MSFHPQIWFNGEGAERALKYASRRDLALGKSSTLRKTAKAFRIAGNAPEPSEKALRRHSWYRRKQAQEALLLALQT